MYVVKSIVHIQNISYPQKENRAVYYALMFAIGKLGRERPLLFILGK